jgi:hypothetical protein
VPTSTIADVAWEMIREDLKETEPEALSSREGFLILDRNKQTCSGSPAET